MSNGYDAMIKMARELEQAAQTVRADDNTKYAEIQSRSYEEGQADGMDQKASNELELIIEEVSNMKFRACIVAPEYPLDPRVAAAYDEIITMLEARR